MNIILDRINSFKFRMRCFLYGIIFLRSKSFKIPENLKVNGRKHKILFSNPDTGSFRYEFTEICIKDCYQLLMLKEKLPKVSCIVDVGANQGMFILAARQTFSKAVIHGYEPNKELEKFIKPNASALNANVHYEAVTKDNCFVNLQMGESHLHTQTLPNVDGIVRGISIRDVVERTGGKIDILKLDCEGGEWEIFEAAEVWDNINSITMEYHLWAKAQSNIDTLFSTLKKLDFYVVTHVKLDETFGMLTAIKNRFK